MATALQATDNAAPETQEDQRRLTESDPDFVLLHNRTQRRLMSSIRQAVRDVKSAQAASPTQRSGLLNEAINRFVQRHLALLKAAYEEAHAEGQVDYWHAVSNVPGKQQLVTADTPTLRKRMAFYAPSVAKMARELSMLGSASRIAVQRATEASITVLQFADPPATLNQWQDSVAPRVALQAQVTWPAMNDGYIDAGTSDSASPFALVWWNLEPMAQHCNDCPDFAANSPYTAPGSGGNELTNTPGDGTMECGAACKCSLAYDAPAAGPVLDALNQAKAQQWSDFLAGDPTSPLPPQTVGGIQPKGTVYTPLQRGYIDEMRAAQEEWNAARGDLPENPDWLRPSDWAQVKPTPWGAMTPYQQGILSKMSQINMDWLHEVGQLNWPEPPYRPDVATEMRQWLEAASRGDFTPWWKDYQEPLSQHEQLQQWWEWMAQANLWPDPPAIDNQREMEQWLEQVGKSVNWPPDFGRSDGENTKAREIALPTIKLYNPNHDSHGRFTYGNGTAASTVARGQGRTRRTAGGKRVTNAGVHAGPSKPGSTGAPSAREAGRIINEHDVAHEDQKIDNLAQRLAGNKDFEDLAAARGRNPDGMVVEMYGDWGMSSNAVNSQALQMAVRDEFGLVGTSDIRQVSNTDQLHQVRLESKSAEEMYAEHGAGYRAFARAQYESTQDYLTSKGVSSFTVYRGSAYDEESGKGGIKWGHSGTASLRTRPISSFTTNPDIGDEFASMGRYQLTISADIPASRVFSFSMTGIGEGYQSELLILGGTDHWSYDSLIEE